MADAPSRSGVTGTYLTTVTASYGAAMLQAQGNATASGGPGWFGPLNALPAVAPPEVAGRQWDYPVGYNLNLQPRAYEGVTFRTLRQLADGYDLLRIIIETRKDQISRMSWSIKSRDAKKDDSNNTAVQAATEFFQRPDGVNSWQEWLRLILEDLLVIDAPTIYTHRTMDGSLLGLWPLDGATIKPLIDDWGRTPRPFAGDDGEMVYPTAYQQTLKGLPAVNYTTMDLIYRPRNRRVHSAYGMSPVEQILTSVNIGLRRQASTLSYYTEGNIPDAIAQLPATWTSDQITTFQKWWDSYFSGDVGRRRKMKFIPATNSNNIHETRKVDLKDEFDDWLARVICFAFSVSPQALLKMVNRASGDTMKELAQEEGLEPWLLWIKALVDEILRNDLESPDLEFTWDEQNEVDEAQQATTLKALADIGALTLNEMRDELGREPYSDPNADLPMILTPTGYVPLSAYQDTQDAAEASRQVQASTAAAMAATAAQAPPGDGPKANVEPKAGDTAAATVQKDALHKYSPDQPRGKDGRFAVGEDDGESEATARADALAASEKKPLLSTKTKIKIGTFLVSAAAVGIAISRNKPYVVHLPQHDAIRNLHTASVHTALSDTEKKAVHEYSNLHYAKINKKLRLGHKPDERINNIDAALDKSALSQDSVVYRGLNQDRSKRLLTKTQPGEVFVDRGYSSTSLSEGVARGFAATTDGGTVVLPKEKHGYVLSINVDKGTNALPLNDDIARHIAEQEVLLPRDSAFRVLRVDHDTKTVYAQHLGVKLGKALNIIGVVENEDAIVEVGDKFVCCADDDLKFYPAPDDDTTAEDYADYVPPQPEGNAEKVVKVDVSNEARDQHGEWTAGGSGISDRDLAEIKSIGKSIAIGVAVTAAVAAGVALAPGLLAVAGGAAAGEAAAAAGATALDAVAAATAQGRFVQITYALKGVAQGAYLDAGTKTGIVALRHAGVDTDDIEAKLKQIHDIIKSSSGVSAQMVEILTETSNHVRAALVEHVPPRIDGVMLHSADADKAEAKAAAIAGIDQAHGDYIASLSGLTKRGKTVEAKAEAAISTKLQDAFTGIAGRFADQLRAEHAKLTGKA